MKCLFSHNWEVENKNGETYRTCKKCGIVQRLVIVEQKIRKSAWVTV
jgi:hypothetical protein